MTKGPLVSVLMNCYNSETYLKESINCVYAQSYDNWEIIFWDNNSTDSSAKIAESFDDRLRYFKGDKTIPLYAARERALQEVRGELVAVLDCDDLWRPDKLEKQVPLFEDQKVGLVFSDTVFFDDTGDIKQLYKTRPYYKGSCFRELLTDYYLSLETVIFRKSALADWKYGFDERFNMIGDADLFRRIGYKWKLDMVDEPLGKWRVHRDSLTQKVPEKFAFESLLLIETYKKIIPNFERDYFNEIEFLKCEAKYMMAKALWAKSKNSQARRELIPYFRKKKMFMTYFLSFLPYDLVNGLIKLKERQSLK